MSATDAAGRDSAPVLGHPWLTTWSIAHAWQTRFATVDGVQQYPMSAAVFYLLRPFASPQLLPVTLAPFVIIGIVVMCRGSGRHAPDAAGESRCAPLNAYNSSLASNGLLEARTLLLLLLAWWLAPALYLAGVPFESARCSGCKAICRYDR